jgi:hypothetical protein
MSKILFLPFRVLGGLLAGVIAKKVIDGLWALIGHEQPPHPKDRELSWPKFIPALLVEGAVFGAARGIVDRASREAFRRFTGTWPGEEPREPSA